MATNWNAQYFDASIARFLGGAAAVAYLDQASVEQAVKGWKMEMVQFYDVQDTQAFLAQNDQAMILVFRGTQTLKDWMTDADLNLVNGPGGKVHDGFLCALNTIWRDLWKILDKKRGHRNLWITGHSLGAALATLATAKIRLEKGHPVNGLYNFGSPRVGDEQFGRNFDEDFWDKTFRFVNNNDVVPRVPFRTLSYRHVGTLKYFDHTGKINNKVTWDELLLDRVKGRLDDLLKPGTDGIKDHAMVRYLNNLIRLLPPRPR